MSTDSRVIFNCKFTHAFDRREANYSKSDKDKIKKKIEGKFDYFSNEKKRVMNLFDYYTGKLTKDETMNLVLENGKYATKEEIEKRKKLFCKYAEHSNLWQGVVSFQNNSFINDNITLEELEQELATSILPKLFKKMGFKDKNNMAYNFSFHTDTKHLHAHISFIEKKPNYCNSSGKLTYRRKGTLSQEELNFMKNEVAITVERKKYLDPMIRTTNAEIDNLKKYFNPKERNFILKDKNDLLLESNILSLGKLLYQERKDKSKKIKFNSIRDEEIKRLTKEIKNYLFCSKSEFYNDYKNMKQSLVNINDYIKNVNLLNNISVDKIDDSYSNYKQDYADNYIYNAIVNHADYFFKNKSKKYRTINEDDILREIVLKEYKKDIKQTRYNVLNNYLSNTVPKLKYKNKYKIVNAVKSINAEMEDAQKEFSKLFKVEEYSKQ